MISKILAPAGAKILDFILKKIESPEEKSIKAELVEQARIKTKSDELDLKHKELLIQSDTLDISEKALKIAKELKKDPESAKIMESILKSEISNTKKITYGKNGKLK